MSDGAMPSPDFLQAVKPEDVTGATDLSAAKAEVETFAQKRERRAYDDFDSEVFHRKLFTWLLFALMVTWMLVVVLFVAVSGINTPPVVNDKQGIPVPATTLDWVAAVEVSDGVLLALVGTMTANVVALFLVVARYLFHRRKDE